MLLMYAEFLDRLEEMFDEVKKAVDGLSQDGLDWVPGPDINSIAVLAAHTAGSTRYWIGEVVGGQPAERERAAEFATRGRGADALKQQLDDVLAHSRAVLEKLSLADLDTKRAATRRQGEYTVAWALLHALEHAAVHAGHVQITRQLWDQRV